MNEIAIPSRPGGPLAPLDELEELLDALPAGKERKELGKALATACQKVRDVQGAAESLDDAAALLAVCADALGDDRSEVLGCLGRMTAMAHELRTAATYDQLDHVKFTVAKLPLELKTLDAAVVRAWRGHVRAHLAGMMPLGHVLGRIPQMATLGQQFRTLGSDAVALEQSLHPPTERLDRLERLFKRRDDLMAQLSGKGIDAEVVRFLQDVAAGSLPLSRLTDGVRQWLEQADATVVFRVALA